MLTLAAFGLKALGWAKTSAGLLRVRWKEALVVLALMAFAWLWFRGEHAIHRAQKAEASLASLVAQEREAAKHAGRVVTAQAKVSVAAEKNEAAAQAQIRTVFRTLTKEVAVYVPAAADARCVLPVGFLRLHDAGAAGVPSLPDPAGRADGEPSGVALSAATGTILGNYEAAHANSEQLSALQQWVRDVQAAASIP